MARYSVESKLTGSREVLTELEATNKYGTVEFNNMIAGIHREYTATDLSVDHDDSEGFFEEVVDFVEDVVDSFLD